MRCPVFGDNGSFAVSPCFFTFGYPRLYPDPDLCLQATLDAWSPPFLPSLSRHSTRTPTLATPRLALNGL